MNNFKYELHSHTSEVSQCSHVNAAQMTELYIKGGYNGLVVTDHLTPEFVTAHGGAERWQTVIDSFLKGYRAAKNAVKGQDFQVFLGMELRFAEYYNEYLVYGIDEEFLYNCGNITAMKYSEFFKSIDRKGIFMLQAHPFRNYMTMLPLEYTHGIEVNNGNVRHDSRNPLALELAKQKALLGIGGSDFHQMGDECKSGIIVQEKPDNYNDFIDLVFNQKRFELII